MPSAPVAEPPASLPIPSFNAPSCQDVLGDNHAWQRSRQAGQHETQLGNRELLMGKVTLAHAAYCRAFFWDRKNVDRHINLATLYLVRRDWKKAAQYGQSALKLDPKSRKALQAMGDALAALNQTKEARVAWLQADGKSKATARQLETIVKRNMALAQRVARMNDFALAERLYRRVLLIEPEQADAMKGIASCLVKAGEYQAAAAWARRAEQLKRSD